MNKAILGALLTGGAMAAAATMPALAMGDGERDRIGAAASIEAEMEALEKEMELHQAEMEKLGERMESHGRELKREIAKSMAAGARGMEEGADDMDREAAKLDRYADRLKNPEYRRREVARITRDEGDVWIDGEHRPITEQDLLDIIPELKEGAADMREGAESMRKSAKKMRRDASL